LWQLSATLLCIDFGFVTLRGRIVLGSDANVRKRMEQPKNVQQPQNHGNYHDAVQDGLDGRLHGDKAIHQPQKNTHHNKNFQELN
jgi:hypothetical protein